MAVDDLKNMVGEMEAKLDEVKDTVLKHDLRLDTGVKTFDANKKPFDPRSRITPNGARLIMRLRQNDMIAIDEDRQTKIVKIVKLSPGKITFVEHFEANEDGRNRDKDDEFSLTTRAPSGLQKLKSRTVHVDPAGVITDSGPPE